MQRREFLELLAAASAVASVNGCASLSGSEADSLYRFSATGQARILHLTDCHAQLNPIYFREPNVNLGVAQAAGRVPHRVGARLLDQVATTDPRQRHALTYLDFTEAAMRFGKVGGFAHLKSLVDQLRAESPGALLLDGGDTWQGSGTALWTQGADMVGACNLLGVDVMTGHWEFTYLESQVMNNVAQFAGEFVSQNLRATEEALFEGVPVYDEDSGHIFPPYTMKTVNGRRIAIIGQAFPYTPIANPSRFIPNWTFGIQEQALMRQVAAVRASEQPDAVILLSHNGMDVDLKLASRVSGIDFILGGHTHDAVPMPITVPNSGGVCVVTNAGSNGKFLGVLDLEFGLRGLSGYQYRLLPVFADLLPANSEMMAYIESVEAPFRSRLDEPLAVAEDLLYRRGNFNGTFDQIICDALRQELNAEVALSPGFRWGTTVLPGEIITMARVLDQTAMTYPETYVRLMKGAELKSILESVADNLFHEDPYFQQGGDMVRSGGLSYQMNPTAEAGARITNLRLSGGELIDASREYRVAGWATTGSASTGAPVWDLVANYLRGSDTARINRLETPDLIGVRANTGIEDYAGQLL